MRRSPVRFALILTMLLPALAQAQTAPARVTVDDYRRAFELRTRYTALALNLAERATWVEEGKRFWYRRSVAGGHEFVMVEAATRERRPAFDASRAAAALAAAASQKVEALRLPFTTFDWLDQGRAIEFQAFDARWRINLSDYSCRRAESRSGPGVRGTGGAFSGMTPNQTARPMPDRVEASPDGKWEALVRNFNLVLRAKGAREVTPLSLDGSEGNAYAANTIVWSPDSSMIAVYRLRPGYHRKVYYIESSPPDQLQPKFHPMDYAKPGDVLDLQQPVLFHVASRKQVPIENTLFPNPFQLSRPVWRRSGKAFTFEYNQRGHQVYRVIEVEAATGKARAVVSEEASTFFCYSGKRYRQDIGDGREVIWMSERDGWNHLYLYDGVTAVVKNQITKGEWVVRGVEKVDEKKRQIWFRASGMVKGQDPYFAHFYRINFDGTGLTQLTEADGNHTVSLAPDLAGFVDLWSRPDHPPVMELRRGEDGKLAAEIERGDIAGLERAGWRPPEVFVAPGRDGKTPICGVIYRPADIDPARKYPVVEQIYAGPQDSFVPKSFSAYSPMQSLAELGFVVVQIDGMGTSNRSKAFHDVAWKNLGDAGFPDRKLWHRAAAAKYPWYDAGRVGVYGHSAGGQNALGALLFHGDFYQAAVSSAGCHDNRMDKIWWNEQWMGWPLGPEYLASSNVENAHRLRGRLLLSVGELDTNVDPASTMQVVNALVKAGKTFDLVVLPGQGHTNGGAYGDRKRYDFFVRHLLGSEPPEWNQLDEPLPRPEPRR